MIFDRCGSSGGYWFEAAARYAIWKKLNLEFSGSYFSKEGKALCSNESTKVKLPTIGLGVKYFFNFGQDCGDCESYEKWSLFVGAGLRFFFYREYNNAPYVLQCIKRTATGGMVNAGFTYNPTKHFFMGLFLDYNFKKLSCFYLYNRNFGNCCNSCVSGTSGGASVTNESCCPSRFVDVALEGLVFGVSVGFSF